MLTIWTVLMLGAGLSEAAPPNVVYILADDLGWNDVGFHGSNQIPTPNIDSLAYTGVILNNYYVNPICTPSRGSLMTGKYPIHTGLQHTVLFGAEPRGLPLSEKLLSEYFKENGYVTRAVGKWHLGSWRREYTPIYRGFESHLGYWTGHQDQNDHTAMETGMWGLDMRRNMDVAFDLHGQHSTRVFTEEAVRLIHEQPSDKPLFLYLAHAAVHSGNAYNPICSRDEDIISAPNITDYWRKRFSGMLKGLDDSVGEVVDALREKGILQNSIIVFSTDNGGPAGGFNLNAASNWPLRGVKNTLWEGGVRGVGLIWSPLITNNSRVSQDLFHITDWLPTLLSSASIANSNLSIDGIDQWESLVNGTVSKREEVLHNIDDTYGNAALMVGDWKILKGTTYNGDWDGWYGPSGRDEEYDTDLVLKSLAGQAVQSIGQNLTAEKIKELRGKGEIICWPKKPSDRECRPLEAPCLFNIRLDPCETTNLDLNYPLILQHLEKRLSELNSTAVPPGNLPIDPKGNPKHWNNVWTNFGDFEFKSEVILL